MILDRASSIYAVLAVMLCTTGVPVRGADHWLDGHLIAPSRVETGTRGQFLAAGDVNGDGSQDLVVLGMAMTNSHLVVSTVLSDGQGKFLDPVITELSTGNPYYFAFFSLADMNGDGKLDMIYGPPVGGSYNQVQIKYGDGLGAFAGDTTLMTQSSASLWGVTDLNQDGKPDLFNFGSSSIGIFENLGGGTFKPLITKPFNLPTGDSVRSVTVADYDHNGQPDLVLNCSRRNPADPEGLAVNVVLNPTSDTVATKTLLFIPGVYTGQVIAVDLNHDQALDLAIAAVSSMEFGGTLYVSFAQGGDSFSEPAQYTLPVGASPSAPVSVSVPFLSAIDLEGTGYPAIFMGRADMTLVSRFDNLQNGTFAPPTYFTGGSTQCLTPVDLDSDGKVDLATATDDGEIALFLNRPGERLQQSPVTGAVRPLATMGQAPLDLNGDGNTDLMTPGGSIFYGDGLGNFTRGPTLLETGGTDVAVGDINGDGFVDVANVFSNGLAYVYGQPDGSFSAPTYETNYWLTRVRITDVDKDGYPDVVSFGSGTMAIRFGQSDHTLAPQVQYPTGISFDPFSHGPVFADVNGDGFLDILGTSGTTQVVYGGPGRTFSQGTLVSVPSGFTPYDVFLQDVNHDSKPDLLLGGKGAGLLLIVYSGDGHGQFTEMSRLTDPDGWQHAFTFFDFDGDDNVDFSACSEGGELLFSSGQPNGTFGAYERSLIATECSGIISTPLRRSEKRGAALASVWLYRYISDQYGYIPFPGGDQSTLTLRVRPRSRDRRGR